jgi:hypothetical protein
MSYIVPSVTTFKFFFDRDFPYGETNEYVKDSDILKAQDESYMLINDEIFPDQTTFSVGHNYLTAHNMVTNLSASAQGVNSSFSFLEHSKKVGNVSQVFSIPHGILASPIYAMLAKTTYGAKYLALVTPFLIGNVGVVGGATLD